MARNKKLTAQDVIQLVKAGCFNEYGRISIHLHDCMGRCVYDLDCEAEEMPSVIWREYMDCVGGSQVVYRGQVKHIDMVRMNNWYGVPLKDVYEDGTGCYWTNDEGKRLTCYATPTIMTAYYYDTAFDTMSYYLDTTFDTETVA